MTKEQEFIRKSKEWFKLTKEEREHRLRMEADPYYAMRVMMQQSSVLSLDKLIVNES